MVKKAKKKHKLKSNIEDELHKNKPQEDIRIFMKKRI